MSQEALYKLVFGIAAVLLLGAIGSAQFKAQRKHRSRFAQAANEYPPLLWVRVLLGIPLWVVLIDWLGSLDWFPWATLALPSWARWLGVGILGLAVALMWWTMLALGSNYRGTMGLHRDHELVTHGPYRFVRHPMNVTMPVFGVGLLFLSANALLGVVTIVLLAIICLMRSPIEERQLRERFGEAYLAYAARTGRYFPRLRRGR